MLILLYVGLQPHNVHLCMDLRQSLVILCNICTYILYYFLQYLKIIVITFLLGNTMYLYGNTENKLLLLLTISRINDALTFHMD